MTGQVGVYIPNPRILSWKTHFDRMNKLGKWKQETFIFRLQRLADRYIKKLEITDDYQKQLFKKLLM